MGLKFGSLFSGIGGMDLGLERAGMTCAWQVEIDDYCNRVLAKHWPHVPRHRDVRTVDGSALPPVDLIAGGFPCQDVSNAGKRVGLGGARSGLWSEFLRIVREVRPRFVLVENVSALLARGVGRVLGELASLGFDAEWSVFPACVVGAPHLRERLFIVAHANSVDGPPWMGIRGEDEEQVQRCGDRESRRRWMDAIAGVNRMADGVPDRVHRLRGLGNAVVPQVAEWIGRRISEVANG